MNGKKAGIVAYGTYIPKFRITVEEIARVWEKNGKHVSAGLGLKEKAIAGADEDAATIAVEASRRAIEDFKMEAQKIGALFVGSESHPYAVKPTATIVADAIQAGPELMAADLEFACKAGTAGIQMCMGFVNSDMIEYGLSAAADTAQGKPGDALEFTAASGGAAIIVGKKESEVIATLDHTCSFTTDTPDFWRRQHAHYPEHGGRFTGEPAYFRHVMGSTKMLFEQTKTTAKDYDYAVFHQPNGKFPVQVAGMLGFEFKKIEQGLITPYIGNTYSGSSMLGLCAVLDVVKPGEKILVTSYGSGAGSDSFALTATEHAGKRKAKVPLREMINEKTYIDYAMYMKHRGKINRG